MMKVVVKKYKSYEAIAVKQSITGEVDGKCDGKNLLRRLRQNSPLTEKVA
jgi:hypothetical protein